MLPLSEARHLGSHGNYSNNVVGLIERRSLDPSNAGKSAREIMEQSVAEIRQILESTTGKINDLSF